MSQQPFDFIEKNRDSFLEGLKEVLRVESISTQPAKKGEVLRCAELEVKKLKEIGLENAQLLQTEGYPIVYGDWLHAPGKPTLLIYGHYDVQPPDPLDQWVTPPFEPTVRDGNLYGRGTSDSKGQHYIYIAAIEAYLKTVGKLPVNVKLLIEGEEESGSGAVDHYVATHADFLKCDAVLVGDTAWHDADHPAIVYSLRGLVYCEVSVYGPSQDLHSGHYGGVVRNPLQALSWILAKLKDENEKILIPGFYDDVKAMTPEEKKDAGSVPFDPNAVCKETGVSDLVSEAGFTPVEANWARPSCDICGIWGGAISSPAPKQSFRPALPPRSVSGSWRIKALRKWPNSLNSMSSLCARRGCARRSKPSTAPSHFMLTGTTSF